MLLDEGGHDLTIGREALDRRVLIVTHEAAVALDISTEDGGKLPFHSCTLRFGGLRGAVERPHAGAGGPLWGAPIAVRRRWRG
jgi:hypothetical protein